MVTLDQYWLTTLIAVILPMLVALVTKQVASPTVKSVVLLLLSAVSGTLTSIAADGGTFDIKSALISTVLTFVIAVGTHFGFLKPVGVTGSEGKIASVTPLFGVGKAIDQGDHEQAA